MVCPDQGAVRIETFFEQDGRRFTQSAFSAEIRAMVPSGNAARRVREEPGAMQRSVEEREGYGFMTREGVKAVRLHPQDSVLVTITALDKGTAAPRS
ncbi:MAG: hypothetical protein DRH20_12925 [Deltaproteobacteria bacterium]|nr:MAG: hypothetical protein DRH20_12925 [Deltaproteobacteria bacterium]